LSNTITHLTKAGRFRQAADREKDIAAIYEQDLHDISKAAESFVRAAEWYEQEEAAAYVQLFTKQMITHFVTEPLAHVVKVLRISALKLRITEGPYNYTT
jgi:hypothetical protein